MLLVAAGQPAAADEPTDGQEAIICLYVNNWYIACI